MMNRRLLLSSGMTAAVAVTSTGLTDCASPRVEDYAAEKPVLDLRTYFNGIVDAWGIFTDRNGKVVKRFTVLMKCEWRDKQGVLDEDFVYSDGTKEKRIWTLTDHGDGTSPALRVMSWAPLKAKHWATPSIGVTRWPCR